MFNWHDINICRYGKAMLALFCLFLLYWVAVWIFEKTAVVFPASSKAKRSNYDVQQRTGLATSSNSVKLCLEYRNMFSKFIISNCVSMCYLERCICFQALSNRWDSGWPQHVPGKIQTLFKPMQMNESLQCLYQKAITCHDLSYFIRTRNVSILM